MNPADRIVDGWDQDDDAGVDGFDRYCPTCRDYFPPADQDAHAGH